jgi:hypothetical protein
MSSIRNKIILDIVSLINNPRALEYCTYATICNTSPIKVKANLNLNWALKQDLVERTRLLPVGSGFA